MGRSALLALLALPEENLVWEKLSGALHLGIFVDASARPLWSQGWSCGSLVPARANTAKPWVKSQSVRFLFAHNQKALAMPRANGFKNDWV